MLRKQMKALALMGCMGILVMFAAEGTSAYFTAEEKAHNVITTSGVNIAIEEWQKTEEGLVPYPKNEAVKVMPGSVVSKIATIKNIEAEAYVRAKVEIIIEDESGNKVDLPKEIISVNINDDAWVRKDGDTEWWYCLESVET